MSNTETLEQIITPQHIAAAVLQKWNESADAVQGRAEHAQLTLSTEQGPLLIAPDNGSRRVDDGHVALVLGSGRHATRIALYQHDGQATVQRDNGETVLPSVDDPGLRFLYDVISSSQPRPPKRRRVLFGLGRGAEG